MTRPLGTLWLLALTAALVLPAEAHPALAVGFTVNSTADAVDVAPGNGVCATSGGACTLRAAIQEANALAGTDNITLPAGTYALTIAGAAEDAAATGDLDITGDSVTISPGASPPPPLVAPPSSPAASQASHSPVAIDGGDLDRVFDIRSGIVSISGVTIQNGSVSTGYGGGIFVAAGATLLLLNSTISGNTSQSFGGGIFNFGSLNLTQSTVSGNQAAAAGMDGFGGGILSDGTASLSNSTVSGNRSKLAGGGILNGFIGPGSLTLTNTTISDNTAGTNGGGIAGGGSASLKNTIVANNTASTGINCGGTVTSAGHNLDSGNSCGFAAAGDLINTNPQLGPLQDNGGLTQTHALAPGSPAIDAGDNIGCPLTDQRGVARPQGAACDIGAYEFQAIADTDGDTIPDNLDPDDDNDRVYDVDETPCGGNPLNASIRPERIDTPGDDDGDTQVNEALPPGAAAYDCDGDGFIGSVEAAITTSDQDPCGSSGWPADLVESSNKLNIADFTSFLFPLGPNDGHGTFAYFNHTVPDAGRVNEERWDLVPDGVINIADLNALNPAVNAPTSRPPMFGGQPAFFTNLGQCPWPP